LGVEGGEDGGGVDGQHLLRLLWVETLALEI
jgi:hypothetical protein